MLNRVSCCCSTFVLRFFFTNRISPFDTVNTVCIITLLPPPCVRALTVSSKCFPQHRKAGIFAPGLGLLDPKNVTVDFDRKCFCRVGDRFKKDSKSDSSAKWRTGSRKNKCAALTDVTTAAFTLLVIPIFVRPPKHNRSLQRETNCFSDAGCELHIAPSVRLCDTHVGRVSPNIQEKDCNYNYVEVVLTGALRP